MGSTLWKGHGPVLFGLLEKGTGSTLWVSGWALFVGWGVNGLVEGNFHLTVTDRERLEPRRTRLPSLVHSGGHDGG